MLDSYRSRLHKIHVVLASNSSNRKHILRDQLGLRLEAVNSYYNKDLGLIDVLSPHEYIEKNATQKAMSVASYYEWSEKGMPHLIIAADTVVVMNNEIIGIPESTVHNIDMLTKLNGKNHEVLTCVSLVYGKEKDKDNKPHYKYKSFIEKTIVKMADLPHDVIEEYVKTGEPEFKPGGYSIQNLGATLVKGIQGDYFNVLGLPVHRTAKEICELLESNLL